MYIEDGWLSSERKPLRILVKIPVMLDQLSVSSEGCCWIDHVTRVDVSSETAAGRVVSREALAVQL
jgi:hypothetical protein